MKQIVQNKYLKGFRFSSSEEASIFFKNQKANNSLSIEGTLGDNYDCYVCYHSLTKEKIFVLSFSSDEDEDNLSFLFWNNCFVISTGKNIYLINDALNIKACLEITTALVGLYIISNERLLLLEEAYLRVIDYNGRIVEKELFDLIDDFSIKDNVLYIQTSEGEKVTELT